jgi:hypothetical protein
MVQFQDLPQDLTPRPTAACRVRVIDVESRRRVYPGPDAQEPSRLLQITTREVDPGLYGTRSGRLQVLESLAVETGQQIAKLFYKHERKELGGNLNPR